ncbi:hypothetical protein NX059_001244 [Plenodomus lindquistii]|nr:hypothetical protein NX059_001244 [Plenodomus lindquistii]
MGSVRCNPFLAHWVEVLRRADGRTVDVEVLGGKVEGDVEVSAEVVDAVRVEWIQRILSCAEADGDALGAMTPRQVFEMAGTSAKKGFEIEPYVRILVEEEILDKSYLPSTSTSTATATASSASPPLTNGHPTHNPQPTPHYAHTDWKQTLLFNLSKDPSTAVRDLTRLPLQLPHLDFLTKLLTDHTLEAHSIEPIPVILSYIQHSLRTIERMEAPPLPSSSTPVNTNTNTSTNTHNNTNTNNGEGPEDENEDETIWEYGKEAQTRSVKLLLLFVKSLIRKGLVGVDVLYFEIQEICYRYVWIGEVRGFRKWVEEGEVGEVG